MTFHGKAVFVAAAALLMTAGTPARAAESVFRCGNSYSQVPCAEGRLVDVDDPRSEGQRTAAREVAAREARLAAQMTRDRERAEVGSAVGTLKILHTKRSASTAALPPVAPKSRGRGKTRGIDGRDFVAFSPKPAKTSTAK